MSTRSLMGRVRVENLRKSAEALLGIKHFNIWAILFVLSISLALSWFPDGLANLIEKRFSLGVIKLSVASIIVMVIWLILRKYIVSQKIEVICEEPTPVRALAIFLSTLILYGEKKNRTSPQELIETLIQSVNHTDLINSQNTEEILADTSWEIPLIVIRHHAPTLEYLYVITSSGNKGTTYQMELFTKTVNALFPKVKVIELVKGGVDFEDVKAVFQAVERFYTEVSAKGIKQENALVDITGGQKTTSVAGAIATLATGRRFQYVSTESKRVLAYDVGYFAQDN